MIFGSSNPKKNRYTPNLEPELWLQIFRFATASPILAEMSDYTYKPFTAVLWPERDWFEHEVSLTTKRSLSLVCKRWNLLVTEFLFEDLHVRRGTGLLKRALTPSVHYPAAEDSRGRWVKRVELASSLGDFDPFRPNILVDILRLCPQTETLVRKYSPGGGDPLSRCRALHSGDFPILYSLKRIDWWFPSGRSPGESFGFLADLLHHSPKLRYLSLGNYVSRYSAARQLPTEQINLPQLTLLRLESTNPELLSFIRYWRLPNLTHLILDPSALAGRYSVLHILGPQVISLELMRHDGFLDRDYLSHILHECPNLKELNYHIESTHPMEFCSTSAVPGHLSLRCIRIHLSSAGQQKASPPSSQRVRRRLDDRSLWDHIYRHLATISASDFPRLNRVVLYGDWPNNYRETLSRLGGTLAKQKSRGGGSILTLGDDYTH